jgi:hypothetical protein
MNRQQKRTIESLRGQTEERSYLFEPAANAAPESEDRRRKASFV